MFEWCFSAFYNFRCKANFIFFCHLKYISRFYQSDSSLFERLIYACIFLKSCNAIWINEPVSHFQWKYLLLWDVSCEISIFQFDCFRDSFSVNSSSMCRVHSGHGPSQSTQLPVLCSF